MTKNRVLIAIFAGLLLVAATSVVPAVRRPLDLSFWVRAGAVGDSSLAAARGEPRAQFLHGLNLIRTNLVTMIDRVPGLSAIPVIGKRFFEKVSYGIDSNASPEQLAEAYRWIKQSADQGFAPAKEAEKLFVGKVPAQGASTTGSQLPQTATNNTPAAASDRH